MERYQVLKIRNNGTLEPMGSYKGNTPPISIKESGYKHGSKVFRAIVPEKFETKPLHGFSQTISYGRFSVENAIWGKIAAHLAENPKPEQTILVIEGRETGEKIHLICDGEPVINLSDQGFKLKEGVAETLED